jgi:hypothetical protein
VVDGFAGPVAILELLDGEKEDRAAEGGGFAQERLTFFVGADAEDGGLQGGLPRER